MTLHHIMTGEVKISHLSVVEWPNPNESRNTPYQACEIRTLNYF